MSRDRPIEKSARGSRSSGGEPEVARSLIIPIARPSPPNEFVRVFISIYLFGCFLFFLKPHTRTQYDLPMHAYRTSSWGVAVFYLFIFFFARVVSCVSRRRRRRRIAHSPCV